MLSLEVVGLWAFNAQRRAMPTSFFAALENFRGYLLRKFPLQKI